MKFNKDTYIVLNLNEPLSNEIINIRKRFDSVRASLPAEITISGSSGVGVVSASQNSEEFLDQLKSISRTIQPFYFSFGEVIRFPNTNIFVFSISERDIFNEIHNKIVSSTIKFEESRFPFFPHCTISSKSDITESEVDKILNLKIPGKHKIDSLSVYQMGQTPLKPLMTIKLGNP